MGRKGKQKAARVETEEEDEDDGMPGLGVFFAGLWLMTVITV